MYDKTGEQIKVYEKLIHSIFLKIFERLIRFLSKNNSQIETLVLYLNKSFVAWKPLSNNPPKVSLSVPLY